MAGKNNEKLNIVVRKLFSSIGNGAENQFCGSLPTSKEKLKYSFVVKERSALPI